MIGNLLLLPGVESAFVYLLKVTVQTSNGSEGSPSELTGFKYRLTHTTKNPTNNS